MKFVCTHKTDKKLTRWTGEIPTTKLPLSNVNSSYKVEVPITM